MHLDSLITGSFVAFVVTCLSSWKQVESLKCRAGYFIRSEMFDVNRSNPESIECPDGADVGCVRFEIVGKYSSGDRQVPFNSWMTACGSRENCSDICSEEMESRMSNILRQIADQRLNTTSTCKTACCLDNGCNSATVEDIKTSGRLALANDTLEGDVGNDDIDDDARLDVGNVLSSAVTAIGDLVSGSLRSESPQVFKNFPIFFSNLLCLFTYYLTFC